MKPRTVATAVTSNRARAALWLCWLLGLLGFVVLASFAATYDYFTGDRWLTEAIQDGDARPGARSWTGQPFVGVAGAFIVGVVAAAGLWLASHRSEAVWLLGAFLSSSTER